ncbi:uncharacterized protein AKAME5_000011200 [Lates japonicus]|uniref:Alkylated DNA repair protein AlkB homologue 8 N-terminal domain-containing protein n=1 Tax=Lates japonicus TaxID=270547 RepID=A0AAD3M1X6_LATJO|nr:uncharacterized protein AKAME5_000011200 [Lates japonicus]
MTSGEGNTKAIIIDGERVEAVQSVRFLRVHIDHDLVWTVIKTAVAKKGPQRPHLLRFLEKAQLPQQLLVNSYRCTESIITYCITTWYPGSENRNALQ